MRKLLSILAAALAVSSCGIGSVFYRNSERYYPGPAIREYQPEGIVEEVQYDCSIPGPVQRRMIVYLPADYYQGEKRYPVFYLLHGARGYETSWIRFGRVYETTDELWREGKAEKCIIVMPNVNQYNNQKDYDGGRFKDAWESIWEVDGGAESVFVKDVVHAVDSLYRTVPDKEHRAIAGLSIGGYQSLWISANNPQMFDYIGLMSPYMWALGKQKPYRREFYGNRNEKLAVQFSESPRGYYLYAGKSDMMRPATTSLHHYLDRHGYPHTYDLYPGGHDWPGGWIEEYHDMLQKVFKDENTVCTE